MRHSCCFAGPGTFARDMAGVADGRRPDPAYDRLFPLSDDVVPWRGPADREAALTAIAGARRGSTDAMPDGGAGIPAGYGYLGQLVVHDLSFTRISRRVRGSAAEPSLANLRSPRLDLDCVYGDGPDVDAPFYERPAGDVDGRHRFRLAPAGPPREPATTVAKPDTAPTFDLPRVAEAVSGGEGRPGVVDPVVADLRNDLHPILSQLVLLFMRVHNRVADHLVAHRGLATDAAFEEARRFVVAAYRNIVFHDYLGRILHPAFHADLVGARRLLPDGPGDAATLPLEYALAAARTGHATTRSWYRINPARAPEQIGWLLRFSSFSKRPELPLPADWQVDWRLFFELEAATPPQPARRFTPFVAPDFVDRTFWAQVDRPGFGAPGNEARSLAFLDLHRCLDLPSGQTCAAALASRLPPETRLEILRGARMLPAAFDHRHDFMGGRLAAALNAHPEFLESTPLAYYLLQEAAVLGSGGATLGPLGSYIVATAAWRALRHSRIEDGAGAPPDAPPVGAGLRTMPEFIGLLAADADTLERSIDRALAAG